MSFVRYYHCVKSVQIRSFFFLNTGKYGPEKTQYLDTFHVVSVSLKWSNFENF